MLLAAIAALAVAPATSAASTGDISTFAGSGTSGSSGDGGSATGARLNFPVNVSTLGSDSYIADYNNQRVRRVNSSGTISTFAGNGTQGYSGDGGAATSATLNGPAGIELDAAGNIYIADSRNSVIRKVTPSGTISTFAGTGSAGYSGDGGAASLAKLSTPVRLDFDPDGNLYVADTGSDTVRKISPGGTITTVAGTGTSGYSGDGGAATAARLNEPRGVAFDRSGNVYIADSGNNRIRKVTAAGTISTIAGTGTGGYSGNGGAATSAQINDPSGLGIDSTGTIFFSEEGNDRVRKISTSGTISLVAGTGTAGYAGDGDPATGAQLNDPRGPFVDFDGDLLIADSSNNRVRRIMRAAAPDAPVLSSTSPVSPANGNTVQIRGTAQSGATVKLYASSACSGTAVVTGTAAAFASPGLSVSVSDNTTTTLYAASTDSHGTTSGCTRGSITYVEDSTAPAAPTIGASPSTPSNGQSPSWSFSGEAGATFQCRLTRGATTVSDWAACTSARSFSLASEADGTYTFSVRATDAAANTGTAATSTYELDTAAPSAATITAGQGGSGSGRTPSWSFTSETGATFECRLDRAGTAIAGWAACTSPRSYSLSAQADGTYTISVRARDAAGNTGAVATSTYLLDTTAPAAPTLGTTPASPGNSRAPSFGFSGETGASFQCRLDRGGTQVADWGSCGAPRAFDLSTEPQGTYTFSVRAVDAAANTGSAATADYVLDSDAPAAPSISTSPATPGTSESPSWSWSGESGATFQCRLSRAGTAIVDWSTCSGSRAYALASEVDGTYDFAVRARDAAGNTGVAATSSYVLDRAAPATPAIATRPATPDQDPTPTWTFTGDAGATFECRLVRGASVISGWGACTSPADYDLLAEADGTYGFSVRARDAAGNTSAAAADSFVLDRAAPAAPSIDAEPGTYGSDTDPTWRFSAEAGASFECRLDRGGGTAVYGWASCASPRSYAIAAQSDGAFTFRVRARDAALNTGPETTSSYTLDRTLPGAPTIASAPASPSSTRAAQWSFSGGPGQTYQCRLERDGALELDWTACTSPQNFDLSARPDGDYEFLVRAKDGLNRIGAQASSNYVLDTTAPAAPSIDGHPASPGTDDTPAWSFSAEAGATFRCRVVRGGTPVTGWATCASGGDFDISAQVDGTYTFEVYARDSAGNDSSVQSDSYVLDRTAPSDPTVTSAPTTPGSGRSPSWSFSGDAGATFECRLDRGATQLSAWGSCSAPRSYDLTDLPDGTYSLSVRSRDAAGNRSGSTVSSYVLDTTNPAAPSVTAAPATPGNGRAPSWSFSGDAGATFECRLDRGATAVAGWASCSASKSYSLSGRPDGVYTFSVRATDAALNTGAATTSSYELDTGAPSDPTIDSAPVSPARDTSVAWAFSGDGDSSYQCRLRRAATVVSAWSACTSPRTYSLGGQVDGIYTFEVTAGDSAGNTSGATASTYTLDRTAPAAPSIDDQPASPSADPGPSWAFTGETGADVECRLTRGATVVSDWASCSATKSYDLSSAPDGAYSFYVRARDSAGNTGTPATAPYTLDRSVPAQPSIDAAPGVTGTSRAPAWAFTGPAALSLECRLSRGATVVSGWAACSGSRSFDLTGALDGDYVFSVRAISAAGTRGPAGTDTYRLDTTAPAAPAFTATPGTVGASRAPAWSFAGEAGAAFECRVTSGGSTVDDWAACSSPASASLAGRPDATYRLEVRARDAAGNTGAAAGDSYQLDTSAPATPDITTAPASPGNGRTPSWAFAGESGATFECSVERGGATVAGWAACASPYSADLSGSPDGTYSLSVRARDAAGNTGERRTSAYELDTTPGAVTIT